MKSKAAKTSPTRAGDSKAKKPGPDPVVLPNGTQSLGVAEQDALRAKFELGPPEWTKVLDAREKAQTIPWGYGRDKVVAMAVDPERLYAYWEVTDEAIARARGELGTAGDDSWLGLRVHDVTNVLFDGGNAHHHFDVGIARADRQWFLAVNRPTSTVIVELGMVARDGGFARIARSHRVDFPRREPAAPPPARDSVEWLTVRVLPTGNGGAGARVVARGRGSRAAPTRLELRDPRTTRLLGRWELASSRAAAASAADASGPRGAGRSRRTDRADRAEPPDAEEGDVAPATIDRGGSEERLRARSRRADAAGSERRLRP